MANTSAIILWENGEEKHPVALRSDLPVSTLEAGGAGRLLHLAYLATGHAVEKSLGRAAHNLGSGPTATSCRIKKAFGDDALTRQSTLDNIYDSMIQVGTTTARHECFLRALKKDCEKLLKYALPSRSLVTQINTFRDIIELTTRYPGLRRIFLQCPDINAAADLPDAICELWRNTECHYDKESRFSLEFAAHCLARHNLIELEDIRPSELGRTSEEGLGVVDRLLVRFCDEGSGFSRLIAIRYLAGILELPTFWSESYESQKFTMDKLCKQALRLIEDINPDLLNADDVAKLALLDPDGIDALAEAVLVGGQRWIQGGHQIKILASHSWLTSFVKLVEVLRRLILPELLPMASRRASENWDAFLKDITNQLPMSSLDWQYEDVYVLVNEQVGSQSGKPPRSDWAPLDIPEEPPSLLKTFTARLQSAFFGPAASGVGGVTPSNSPPGEEPARGNYLRPETPRATVDEILAEENYDESIQSRSLSLIEDTNAANGATILGSAAFNIPVTSSDPFADMTDYPHQQAFSGPSTGDNGVRRTASHGSHQSRNSQSHASVSASTRSWVYSNQMNPPPPLEPTPSVDYTPFHGPRPLPEAYMPPARWPSAESYDHQQPFSGPSTRDLSGDNGVQRTASHGSGESHNTQSHPSVSASTRSWVYSNQMNPPPPLEPTPSVGHTPFHGPRPLPEPNAHYMASMRRPFHDVPEEDEDEEDYMQEPQHTAQGLHFAYQSQAGGPARYVVAEPSLSSVESSPVRPPENPERDRSFVGGFFKGLERIPRMLRGGRDKRQLSPLGTEAHTDITTGNTLPRYLSNPSIGPTNPQFAHRLSQAVANGSLPADITPAAFQLRPALVSPRQPVVTVTPHSDISEEEQRAEYLEGPPLHEQLIVTDHNPTNPVERATMMAYNRDSEAPTVTQTHPTSSGRASPPRRSPRVSYPAELPTRAMESVAPNRPTPQSSTSFRRTPRKILSPLGRSTARNVLYAPPSSAPSARSWVYPYNQHLPTPLPPSPTPNSAPKARSWVYPYNQHLPTPLPPSPTDQYSPLPGSLQNRNAPHAMLMADSDDDPDDTDNAQTNSLGIDFGHHQPEPLSSKNKGNKSMISRVFRGAGSVFGKEASPNDRKLKRKATVSYGTVPTLATYGDSSNNTNAVRATSGPSSTLRPRLGVRVPYNSPISVMEVPETEDRSDSPPPDVRRLSDNIPPLRSRAHTPSTTTTSNPSKQRPKSISRKPMNAGSSSFQLVEPESASGPSNYNDNHHINLEDRATGSVRHPGTVPHDVAFNSSTGKFTEEWQQFLQESGISRPEQEKNPQAIMEIVKFYQQQSLESAG